MKKLTHYGYVKLCFVFAWLLSICSFIDLSHEISNARIIGIIMPFVFWLAVYMHYLHNQINSLKTSSNRNQTTVD